ncbi:MAG: succinate dehydrogenase, cytochrome b556 subunit [Betaproteobacteria bacterium]|nr:succinate dehydrogenase, cytochrome b556 subunit [Betaproteobacteria bacterium]
MAETVIKKRPKHLNLLVIRQPLPAILSILHRASGAAIFLLLPVLICMFQMSLTSAETYAAVRGCMNNVLVKIILFGLLWLYMHHFCAGIRFLLLDVHVGVDLSGARLGSKIVFVVSIVLTLIVGVKIIC